MQKRNADWGAGYPKACAMLVNPGTDPSPRLSGL